MSGYGLMGFGEGGNAAISSKGRMLRYLTTLVVPANTSGSYNSFHIRDNNLLAIWDSAGGQLDGVIRLFYSYTAGSVSYTNDDDREHKLVVYIFK